MFLGVLVKLPAMFVVLFPPHDISLSAVRYSSSRRNNVGVLPSSDSHPKRGKIPAGAAAKAGKLTTARRQRKRRGSRRFISLLRRSEKYTVNNKQHYNDYHYQFIYSFATQASHEFVAGSTTVCDSRWYRARLVHQSYGRFGAVANGVCRRIMASNLVPDARNQ